MHNHTNQSSQNDGQGEVVTATREIVKLGATENLWIEAYLMPNGEIRYAPSRISLFLGYANNYVLQATRRSSGKLKAWQAEGFAGYLVFIKLGKASSGTLSQSDFSAILRAEALQGNPVAIAVHSGLEIGKKPKLKLEKGKRATESSLYIIGDLIRGVCKIGVSKEPQLRLCHLQTAYPWALSILFSQPVNNAYSKERQIHAALSDFRLQGEWFDSACLSFVDWSSLTESN